MSRAVDMANAHGKGEEMSELIPCVGGPLDGQLSLDVGPKMVHEVPPENRRHSYDKQYCSYVFFGSSVQIPIYDYIGISRARINTRWFRDYFCKVSQNDTILPWDFPASLGRFGKGTPIPIVRDWFEEHGYPNFGICSILTMIVNRTLVSVCGPKVFPSWQEAILSLDFRRDQ